MCKILDKVLKARLSTVMDDLISPVHSAYVKGRKLVDGVLVGNEVIDFAKTSRKACLIFKVDFEKAYDSISWIFLEYMLRRFGFDDKWRAWIQAYVFFGNLYVLVNGSPTNEINSKWGMRQGDHLAPFLFLLVAKSLSWLMCQQSIAIFLLVWLSGLTG